MHVVSFDVFDTLVTRVYSRPTDLFSELGAALRDSGLTGWGGAEFISARVRAENTARGLAPRGEATLAEIYGQLAIECGWSAPQQAQAQSLEMAIEERSLRAVPGMREVVERERENAGRMLFLSDMYLPEAFVAALLGRLGFMRAGDGLFVSNAHRCSKSTGELYLRARSELAGVQTWQHFGDHPQSDVEVPRRLGIAATEAARARLTRYEKQARSSAETVPSWQSKLAGAMRLARLANPETDRTRRVMWDSGCNTIGPLWAGFVRWCFSQAQARGFRRLYFVARDGQLLVQLGRILAEEWRLPIECRYLLGSRQAWHAASFDTPSEREFEWLFVPTPGLSLRQVIVRLGIPIESVGGLLEHFGFGPSSWDIPLTAEGVQALKSALQSDAIAAVAAESAQNRRRTLVGYLEQERVLDGTPFAIVDLGWGGNALRSLGRALTMAGRLPRGGLDGLYFGLCPDVGDAPGLSLVGYWNQFHPLPQTILRENIALLELFAAATHGSVMGYAQGNGRVEAVLDRPTNESALNAGLDAMHAGSVQFAREYAREVGMNEVDAAGYEAATWACYRLVHDHPAPEEAIVWGRLPFSSQQVETEFSTLAPAWGVLRTISAIWDHQRRPFCWWPEAAHAISPSATLGAFLALRRVRRALNRNSEMGWPQETQRDAKRRECGKDCES